MQQSPSGSQSASASQPPNGDNQGPNTPIWLAIGVIFALIIGIGAGVIDWLGQRNVPLAILYGGAAFGGTMMLVIALIRLLSRRS